MMYFYAYWYSNNNQDIFLKKEEYRQQPTQLIIWNQPNSRRQVARYESIYLTIQR